MIAEGKMHQSLLELENDYALLDSLTEEGQLICPEIKEMIIMQEGNLSLAWKGLKRGGVAKAFTNPCTTCCVVTSANLAKPNQSQCAQGGVQFQSHVKEIERMTTSRRAMKLLGREAIIIACMKEDYTNDGIFLFHKHVDDFFHPWLEIHGISGMPNCIHMLSSGHIAEYMHRYRNLFRHSQQGFGSK